MNIAQPVASGVESVEFTFLSPKEIRSISVKRIENDSTFDNLLNPVPGGLYDPALGSWGDAPCTTCNLNQSTCPGHAGHIQLPVPVYHPVFMDQAYRLLKAACVYCKGFRLPQKELHKYVCKLKLLQHGLIQEAHIVGAIGENDLAIELGDFSGLESEAEEEGDSNSIDNVTRARDRYVDKCLRGIKVKRGETKRGKHEGASEMRREIIKEFLAEITKRRICASCGGISPSYRKDRFVKVFERSLSDKEKAKMAQKNFKQADAMARVHQATTKQRPDGYSSDEGVADVGSPTREKAQADEDGADQDIDMPDADTAAAAVPQRYISAMEVQARLNELFTKEQELMALLYNAKPATRSSSKVTPDMFFLTILMVPPNRYRPEARTGDSQISEAQQNSLYKNILRGCGRIAQLHAHLQEERADVNQLHQAWTELQESVNALIDKDKNPVQGAAAKRNEDGIKQKLEKKEGLFRKNMMGKRVNYAARSVISPDPNIETNEIGVPPVFAKKLTYPEPVTSHNFRDMQQAVINGVDKWPGAFAIENENGQIVNLRNKSVDDRVSLANQLLAPTSSNAARTRNKKVYRHLTNGDVVLMNRQPTLHKPSIMGHRVRVLPNEKTIRMHYANCNTYNADFDGDEMNMHFPQNEVARAEALQIADTDHQYLSYTAGKPLRGLIQDHISVSVALCNRDTFFSRGDYQQLVYNALRPESGHIVGERIELVAPAVIRPVPRWTGKQVITTILKNMQPPNCGGLCMRAETQIKASQWGKDSEEGVVLFQDGEFITGILDKSQIGPSSGGVVHAVHEIYGPAIAGKLLSSLGRLLTRYLNVRAFSCGMDDLRLTPEGEKARREALVPANTVGLKVASSYVSLEQNPGPRDPLLLERLEEVMRDDSKQEGLDLLMKEGLSGITDKVQTACVPNGLEKPFPKNQMQAMTTSGAKGSRVNASLISCNLGQQVLEGRRVPIMVSGKSLPCFNPFETHARAGGYIVQRFLTGIRPQEYYFHHMAGREGLIDTAVKTSRSGYLQRCVIKGMEGLTVAYDTTVRDADGSMIQFLYGEDGLDVTKQKYLNDFSFILENVTSQAAQLKYDPSIGDRLGQHREAIAKYMKKALKHVKAHDPKAQDPLSSMFNPATTAFATSENFYQAMTSYLKENKDGLVRDKSDKKKLALSRVSLNRKNAEMLFAMKYLRSLVEPGEAVGIVAGQSVGEPSTQMTLNTFHLAGHSAKNVTLGIPRLREILMTASDKISTPAMSLYPIDEMSTADAETFAKSISVLPLGYILDSISVEEKVGRGKMYGSAKVYRVDLKFFASEEYTKTYAISVSDVMDAVERKLLHRLLSLVKKDIKKRRSQSTMATPEIGVKAGVVETAAPNAEAIRDEDDDDDEGDDDATNAKQRANRTEAVSYGPNDDDDDAVQQEMARDATDDMDEDEGIGGSPRMAPVDDDDDEDGIDWSAKARTERVLDSYAEVTDFTFDAKSGNDCSFTLEFDSTIPKVLMLNLVQEAVKKTVVQEISGVGACTFVEEKGVRVIHTAGVNLQAMQRYSDFIDPHRIQTNDIAAVLAVYGVEAARSNIVQELAGVFGSHGIKVDNRHLNLIGDHMTRNGGFTPFNRMGLKGNVSPFTKMSFETTLSFLKDAVLDGDWDDLATPSGRSVMGKLGKVGTGGFDVLAQLPTYHVDSLA
ncbi:DNA-directed RNA polymerase subunit [Fusarium keratoplasticum]|uniref:DNA-directed RNA polymerase subunit n=1 Tax=Fusarium keratoplasticum TaxID=1328300 RepID=A0ACC0QRL1_9HYPO|nr:DNA-directed RNA polymerase subunit [Fusarium keratoplasticum]KAI8660709.1 DNA-directed RNA polymerase subunit [Fusarium keratoplasticum]KAI8661737.1 DNA-directed RNA polymerase subunit [Fusarium keratoplasticum]